ncbi:MAG: hypothetical protein ACQEQW_06105 [Bacteroidota bacterium]
MKVINLFVAMGPTQSHGLNALRISLSVFNKKDDLDVLVKGLKEFTAV